LHPASAGRQSVVFSSHCSQSAAGGLEQLWRTNEGHSQAVPDRLAAGRKSYPSTHNERQQNATLAEAVLDLQGGNAKDALARLEGLPAPPVPFDAWVSIVRAQALLRLGQGEAAALEFNNILAHWYLVLFSEDAKDAVLLPLSYLGLGRARPCRGYSRSAASLRAVLRHLEGRRRRHPHPQGSEGGIRKAEIICAL